MASIRRGLKYLISNRTLFFDSIIRNFLGFLPDKLYLSLRYRCVMGNWINWKNPKTFSEKLQWLKIYDRKSTYTSKVDKYAVKQYVAEVIGEEYIIPTLGVWDRPEDIDWSALPNQFVIKTTHGGGGTGVLICRDKQAFDVSDAIKKLNYSLSLDIYSSRREWPYKDVPQRVIVEKYICPIESTGLKDYKFFCFNGKVKFFKVDFGRFVEHHANYYSPQGHLLDFGELDYPPIPDASIELPTNLPVMIDLAEKLSKGFPFIRIDLYNNANKVYFGEMTFYPASGMGKWTNSDADLQIGDYLSLPTL